MKRLVSFGPYRLDAASRVLRQEGRLVPLPSKAVEVLLILVERRGEVVPKNDLMEAVWPDVFVEEGNLTQHIHLLRKALQDRAEEHRYILTVPQRGYCFVAAVQEIETEPTTNEATVPSNVDNGENRGVNKSADSFRVSRRFIGLPTRTIVLSGTLILCAFAAIAGTLTPMARHFNNKAIQLQGRGEIQAAIEEYRRALLLRPSYAEARYNIADAYEEIPDYDKAVEEYQKAIDADVTLYPAYNNLARLHILRRKDPGSALKLLDRGLSNNPQEVSVKYSFHKNYGWANLELQNYLRAEQELSLAIRLDTGRGAAHCLLAKVLEAEGKAAETHSEWKSCLAYSIQEEVEPEWRNEALEKISKENTGK